MSDLSLDVNFEGSGIEVDAEFGYSNTRYVSPSEYTGELTVVPSHERHILETTGKMLNGNVTVEAAPTSEVIFTENGEYLPPEGEVGFRKVEVDVPSEVTYDGMASGTQPAGDITITGEEIVVEAFRNRPTITGVNAPNCKFIRNQAFMGCYGLTSLSIPKAEVIGDTAFSYNKLQSVALPAVKTMGTNTFGWSSTLKTVVIGEDIESIGEGLLRNTTSGWICKFLGTPASLASRTFYNTQGGDIYVPWTEGEVANAPWGATTATVHYNTVYDEEWNVISST